MPDLSSPGVARSPRHRPRRAFGPWPRQHHRGGLRPAAGPDPTATRPTAHLWSPLQRLYGPGSRPSSADEPSTGRAGPVGRSAAAPSQPSSARPGRGGTVSPQRPHRRRGLLPVRDQHHRPRRRRLAAHGSSCQPPRGRPGLAARLRALRLLPRPRLRSGPQLPRAMGQATVRRPGAASLPPPRRPVRTRSSVTSTHRTIQIRPHELPYPSIRHWADRSPRHRGSGDHRGLRRAGKGSS